MKWRGGTIARPYQTIRIERAIALYRAEWQRREERRRVMVFALVVVALTVLALVAFAAGVGIGGT